METPLQCSFKTSQSRNGWPNGLMDSWPQTQRILSLKPNVVTQLFKVCSTKARDGAINALKSVFSSGWLLEAPGEV